MLCGKDGKRDSVTKWRICYSGNILPVFLTTVIDPSLPLVLLLSKSSKSLDHMLRKEYTVYCFEILWIGHMLRYHTDGFPESSTTVSQDDDWRFLSLWCLTFSIIVMLNVYRHYDDFHTPSFRAEARMLCEKDGKRDSGTEWRICYSDDSLPSSSSCQQILRIHSGWHFTVFLTAAADSSLICIMTPSALSVLWLLPFAEERGSLKFKIFSP